MAKLTQKTHIRHTRRLLLFMLPAILWLFFNTTANRHIHVLANGYVISHAHPVKKSGPEQHACPLNPQGDHSPEDHSAVPPHKQTEKELILLSLFSEFLYSLIVLVMIRPLTGLCPQIIRFRCTHWAPAREYYQVHHYHAPPECR